MNTFYDLIAHRTWFLRSAYERAELENQLRSWIVEQNAEQNHSVTLSHMHWVGDIYTQKIRCKNEYQVFLARLTFGELFTTMMITEQDDGMYIFK